MGNQHPRLDEIAWLAGLLDGDGHFGIEIGTPHKKMRMKAPYKITTRIYLGMTDLEVITKAMMIFKNMGFNVYFKEHHKKPPRKVLYEISINRMSHTKRAIGKLIKYLSGKKKRTAQAIWDFINSREKRTGLISGKASYVWYNDFELEKLKEIVHLTAPSIEVLQKRLKKIQAIENYVKSKDQRLEGQLQEADGIV